MKKRANTLHTSPGAGAPARGEPAAAARARALRARAPRAAEAAPRRVPRGARGGRCLCSLFQRVEFQIADERSSILACGFTQLHIELHRLRFWKQISALVSIFSALFLPFSLSSFCSLFLPVPSQPPAPLLFPANAGSVARAPTPDALQHSEHLPKRSEVHCSVETIADLTKPTCIGAKVYTCMFYMRAYVRI